MLPLPPRLLLQSVDRPRRDVERDRLLTRSRGITSESHSAGADERYAHHTLEIRNVAVPSKLRPRRVLRDQRVREVLRRAARPCGSSGAKGIQEWGNRLPLLQLLRGEVVAPAVADDASLGQETLVFGLREWQPLDLADQRRFL